MTDTGGAFGVHNTSTELADASTLRSLKKGSFIEKEAEARPSDSTSNIEKGSLRTGSEQIEFLAHGEPFPEDEAAEKETQQFTFRAVLVGCILGGVIAASNLYLGLKTGWTFGASLFGSIVGYAILKPLSKALPLRLGGGYFGPKENVCCQSAATSAGSLGLLFTSGFPAAYQLGLLGDSPKADFGKLITFTACCAYYGMFFAIPLRKLYVVKQKLVFPTGFAAAQTIRALHAGKGAEVAAKKKTRALFIAFLAAITLRCVSEYAPGLLWDWHWGWTLYRLGWSSAIYVENWNFILEFTPAFTGVGMLVGLNAAYSFFGGTILAWGIIAPSLVTTRKAFGEAYSSEFPGWVNYMGMVLDDPVNSPSPRYWLIWPGTMLLLCGSFAEVFANYRTLWASVVLMVQPITRRFFPSKTPNLREEDLIDDPAPVNEQVPWWMIYGGLAVSIFFTCLVLGLQYKQNVGISILSIIFGFLFSFIGVESCGRTNIIPVTSIGNASQLVIGGITKPMYSPRHAELYNLTGGLVALGASEQSADMVSDLKTAHLLRASPRVQFYAQCCGALVSIFMSAGMYVLFTQAYPCINDLSLQARCSFPAPDVGAWRAIAVAVSQPALPIPPSAGYTAIALGVFAVAMTAVKYSFIPARYHIYVPNFNAIGIAMILPTTTYPTAVAAGATIAYFWHKKGFNSYAMYCYAIAAGMIAGEGLGGIIGAILQVAQVSGSYKGTAVGCPGNLYCG